MANSNSKPNFLCIGAQKSGSSWLNHQLRRHPQIWMPPLKELNYFDIPHRMPIIIHWGKHSLRGRRVYFARRIAKRNPRWVMRYLLLPRTDRWYQSLFSPDAGQICGETTPAYAKLATSDIARVKALSPGFRIIYLMRNPVEQIWSQTKMWVQKFHASWVDDLSPDEIVEIIKLNWESFRGHADYLANLTRWQQLFPTEQIYVAYFDDLQAAPAKFLESVLAFLDLPMSDSYDPAELATPRNARPSRPMHNEVRHWIIDQWYENMAALNDQLVHPHTASWLQQAQAFRNSQA